MKTTMNVSIDRGQVEAIDATRADVPCTRSELVRLIFGEWIKRGRHVPLTRRPCATLDTIPPGHRPRVESRLKIINEWHERRRSRRRGQTIVDVTATFLNVLARRGVIVSRATLFNWERRFKQLGAAGLMDRRRPLPPVRKGGKTAAPVQRRASDTRAKRRV